jgi:tryptophanyl-tRNA synthetase
MKRILTGIQCTNKPHLGNILGAMLPTIQLAESRNYENTLVFLADLHTLTTIKDPLQRKDYLYTTLAAWLALGLDPQKAIIYRQSKVAMICELTWYLSCFTPFPMLANAHAFKDKADRMDLVNAGLFTYPILMAADILLYDAELIPTGKDQLQHIEIARDIALRFNNQYGPMFILPTALVDTNLATVPGTDGKKMSKSYHNTIDIFAEEEILRKSILQIQTDSRALHEHKDPDTCTVFRLYSLLASPTDVANMRERYLAGGYGYGQAKEALLSVILERFSTPRSRFQTYLLDPANLESILIKGEEQAKLLVTNKLAHIRNTLGY